MTSTTKPDLRSWSFYRRQRAAIERHGNLLPVHVPALAGECGAQVIAAPEPSPIRRRMVYGKHQRATLDQAPPQLGQQRHPAFDVVQHQRCHGKIDAAGRQLGQRPVRQVRHIES